MRSEQVERQPMLETDKILRDVIHSLRSQAVGADSLADWRAARDAFFPEEYQRQLEEEGVTIHGGVYGSKTEIIAEIPTEKAPGGDILRVIVRGRLNGRNKIITARGNGEWPVAEYSLPGTFEESRAKIKEVISSLLEKGGHES